MTRRRGVPASLLLQPPSPPHRPATRRKARLTAIAAGAVLTAAGAAGIAVAVAAGQPGVLTGAATQVPATVQTSAPKLTSAPMARALAASVPLRVEIPALRVSAPLVELGRNANGTLQVPPLDNHDLAGWFDRSVTPGQKGTSIILGHVDSFTGPSVFFSIKMLRPGDIIDVVRADGDTAVFSVDGVQEVAKATFPASIIDEKTRYPELRLITCGGPFNTATRQYLDNIVVYSHLTR
jgi:sortase (surface protein transpeptidase)